MKWKPSRATHRFFPEPTLCLSKSFETFDLATDATLELCHLLRRAGNARHPHLDSSVINIADGNGVLQGVLLNCGEEIYRLDFAADSAFDPRVLGQLASCKQGGASPAYFSGSFRFCNLAEKLATSIR